MRKVALTLLKDASPESLHLHYVRPRRLLRRILRIDGLTDDEREFLRQAIDS